MAKCTGKRCPMQVGYKVDECDYKDCPWRTEQMTNADRIRAMSDEELAKFLDMCESRGYEDSSIAIDSSGLCMNMLEWLHMPTE